MRSPPTDHGRAPEAPAGDRAIHRVLVAFDGSPGSWAALRRGIAIAARERALLTIAGVVKPPSPWIGVPPVAPPVTRQDLVRDAEREVERLLAAARDEVPAAVSVTTHLLRGRPRRVLARLAAAGGYDVVLPVRRRAGLAGALRRRAIRS